MKERPILFSAPMVRAILDGTKTQTRRNVKPNEFDGKYISMRRCPYGIRGDRLWVRETARVLAYPVMGMACIRYEADGREAMVPWPERLRPVVPMACVPNGCHREAARIHLEITRPRVERLQEISPADAAAEGLDFDSSRMDQWHVNGEHASGDAVRCYAKLWESLNGAGSWDANPLVWVIEFNRAEAQP